VRKGVVCVCVCVCVCCVALRCVALRCVALRCVACVATERRAYDVGHDGLVVGLGVEHFRDRNELRHAPYGVE
jgi:hypothetical protein